MTGSDCLQFTDAEASLYMQGILHGLFVSEALGATPICVDRFTACTATMRYSQAGRIFKKYLQDNPEQLHWACNILALNALGTACGKLNLHWMTTAQPARTAP